MYILSLAIKNLLRNKRKTFVLALLIMLVSLLVFVTNAVFEQTNTGLRSVFENYLTADYLISENSEKINSIFGYEMPLVSEYEPVEQLQAFLPISQKLESHTDVLQYTPIISAAVRLEVGKLRRTVPIFGIDTKSYFEMFSDFTLTEESVLLLEPGNKGVLVNSQLARSIEKELNKSLKIGDTIQLTASSDGSFRIRQAVFAGEFDYPTTGEPFDRIILADPQLVRELLQYSNSVEEVSDTYATGQEIDTVFEDSFDDLFSAFDEDIEHTQTDTSSNLFGSIDSFFDEDENKAIDYSNIVTWSFILIKAKENVHLRTIENLLNDKILFNTDVKLMNWSTAAGLSAQAPLALQISFNIGMAFIILGAILVIMNGLVISVLERTNEIGTMRAMGASKNFVKKLYSVEMIFLIIFFSIVGIILGIIVCAIIQANPIYLQNSFLVTLFGSSTLFPLVSVRLVGIQLCVSALIAFLAWQYPVHIATSIQPAQVMGKGL